MTLLVCLFSQKCRHIKVRQISVVNYNSLVSSVSGASQFTYRFLLADKCRLVIVYGIL